MTEAIGALTAMIFRELFVLACKTMLASMHYIKLLNARPKISERFLLIEWTFQATFPSTGLSKEGPRDEAHV